MGKFKAGTRIRLIKGAVEMGGWGRSLGEVFLAADDYENNYYLNTDKTQPPSQAYYRRDGKVTHCPADYWELADIVTEEMVVVKTIHPGVYGDLDISSSSDFRVGLKVTENVFDKASLSTLISDLEKIRDALLSNEVE